MANTSISGLVSGLDTASIVSQLMQIEAQPQTVLRTRVNAQQAQVTALQAINTKLAGIAAKAADLAKLTAWSPTTATSSNDKVSVKAAPGAAASQIGFTVTSVASSYRASYATAAPPATAGTMAANAAYRVTFGDGTVFDFDTGDGSLTTIAAKLNASGSGLDASLVRVGTDGGGNATYALNVQAEATGSAAKFTITPQADVTDVTSFLGGVASSSGGVDAAIRIEGQPADLKSATNTFKDLMPGVDVTLSAGADTPPGTVTTITVARDAKSLSDSVKAMVDAVNSVLSDIDTQTAYNPTTKKSGTLAGDSLLRGVRDQLLAAVTSGQNNVSFADAGVQVDRYGKLVFDEAKFQAAYAANPTATAAKFTDGVPAGLASAIARVTTTASGSTDGTLTMAINGRNSSIRRMNDDISDWDVRLDIKRKALQRQYGALEVALGKLQNQSSWLAGQISSLPKMGS